MVLALKVPSVIPVVSIVVDRVVSPLVSRTRKGEASLSFRSLGSRATTFRDIKEILDLVSIRTVIA